MSNVCGAGCGCHDDACFDRGEPTRLARDPVCGKKLDCEGHTTRQFNWDGATFFFCSTKCMTDFINDPKKYLKRKTGFFRLLKWH